MSVGSRLTLAVVGAALVTSPLSAQSDSPLPAVGTHAVTFSSDKHARILHQLP